MMSTVESVATNGYPGDLVIVVSIDGTHDAPHLYDELVSMGGAASWGDSAALRHAGTAGATQQAHGDRAGHGAFMKALVAMRAASARSRPST